MSKSTYLFLAAVLPIVSCASGCATQQHEIIAGTEPIRPRGVVYVADGAGDFRMFSHFLRKAIDTEGLPLSVRTFVWSHGSYRVVADQICLEHIRQKGHRLAEAIAEQRRCCPDLPIYLAGHCAGSTVILAAAEELPPETVDRIIMLAPSVPNDYDLRRALCTSRDGIDVFWSREDNFYLGIGLAIVNAFRGRCYSPAGRVGFQPIIESPEDAHLYSRLRQYPWEPTVACTGNLGGHFGAYQQGYLRTFILPLFSPGAGKPTLDRHPNHPIQNAIHALLNRNAVKHSVVEPCCGAGQEVEGHSAVDYSSR